MSTFLTPEHYGEIKSLYPRFNEPWTEEEVEELRDLFDAEFTPVEMAGHLGRTPNSVKMKLKALGLYIPKPAPRPWTKEDDERLLQMYFQDCDFEDIAGLLGRTQNAIFSRLVRLRAGRRPETATDTVTEQRPEGATMQA